MVSYIQQILRYNVGMSVSKNKKNVYQYKGT